LAAPTTTPAPSTTVVITTTVEASTTVPTEDQRQAEVEDILTDLWFGWFDAIYRKDADALWEVVATTAKFEAGVEAMNTLVFVHPPTPDGIDVKIDKLLLDRTDCLVPFGTTTATFLNGEPSVKGLEVLWPDPRHGWRLATSWVHAEDLWLADCDDVVRENTP
jgi:hypothetical protein